MRLQNPKTILAAALLSAGLAATGMGLSVGTAQAETPPSGPNTWCPGDPPVETGNKRVNPVRWDESICHEYWFVYFGQGNVASNIWDGPNPPGPPPGQGFKPPPPIPRGGAGGCSFPRRALQGCRDRRRTRWAVDDARGL